MKRTPEGDGRDKCMPLSEEQSFYPSVRTLMALVTLIKCLQSIKEYAFVKSLYPVIVTLEDHLTADLQAQVAEMVIETFGELLYYLASRCLEEFPSPEALKH